MNGSKGELKKFNKTAFMLVYIDKNVYQYFHHIYQYETRGRCFTFYFIVFLGHFV